MTRVKALAIAAITTVTFLSLGLGISAHSSHKDTGDALAGSVAQADVVAMPADPIGLSGSSPAARSVRHKDNHEDDDDHDRDVVKTTRSSTHDREHDDEDEDD